MTESYPPHRGAAGGAMMAVMAELPTVLVTGASSGIGRETALHLAARGFRVLAGVRRPEDGAALEAAGGGAVRALRLDVTREADRQAAAEVVAGSCGAAGLAGLVHNAGIVVAAPLELLPEDALREQFEVNVLAPMALTRLLLPALRRARGRIVHVGSISGRLTWPVEGAYCASKHALRSLNDALRLELAPWGIRVVLVEPGPVATPIWERSLARARGLAAAAPKDRRVLYEPLLRVMEREAAEAARTALPAACIARTIHRALTARRPPARVLPGFRSRWATRVQQCLPAGVRDRIILRRLGWLPPPR